MNLIDFDKKFQAYLHGWIEKNAARFPKAEDMEAQMPDVYLRFVNQRFDWLSGLSPSEYFDGFDDPAQLIDMLRAYEDQDISAPDLLLERLSALGERSVQPLTALANDRTACDCLRATALNVLIEIGTDSPMQDCLAMVDARTEEDEVADVAAELLKNLGDKPVKVMLERLEGASPSALATYLDLLCNFPGDERIYEYTVREFLGRPDQRAMFASFLGKLGDERAVEPLRTVMNMEDINYLDYLEIANAIEMLGGEAGDRDRDFSGDPYYESLREM